MIAIDQYGQVFSNLKHPRKDLMNALCNKHCSKMYIDKKDGSVKHIGYVIGGHWLTLYERVEK